MKKIKKVKKTLNPTPQKPAIVTPPAPPQKPAAKFDLNGKLFDNREDLIRSIQDDYAEERRTRIPPEIVAARAIQPGKLHAIHPGRLHGLLVMIIGHRAAIYCALDELKSRVQVVPNERASSLIKTAKAIQAQFEATCKTELELLQLVESYWPQLELPHGAGVHTLPPNLYTVLEAKAAEQAKAAADRKLKKKLKKKPKK